MSEQWFKERGWKHTGAFAEWVRKWDIGPSMNDRYRKPEGKWPKNYSGFDGEVGEGWVPILDRLANDLVMLGWDRQCDQIKEKFGGLRFYIGEGNDAMWRRIDQATNESEQTCENCGAPGHKRGRESQRYWIKTFCDDCDKTVSR